MAKKPIPKSSILEEMKAIEEATNPKNLKDSSNIILVPISEIYEIEIGNGITMHNRISYSLSEITELAGNIKDIEPNGILKTGLLQPIILRKNINGKYERISGFRRIEAFKINNATEIPAIILENISNATARFMRNSENLKRENINPYDELYGIIENIALSLNITFKETISFLNKIKNHNSGKTSFNDNDKEMYITVSDVVRTICKYEVGSLIERLIILNMNILILDSLRENAVNYSQAKEINKIKNDDIIKKLLYFVKNKNISISELRFKIKELLPEKTIKMNSFFNEAFSKPSFNEKDYKNLEPNQQMRAEKILKELINLKKDLEELLH